MDDLYRQLIIDRYKNPLYRGSLDPHDLGYEDDNPLCGDHIRIEMRVNEDGISQASADLLIEYVIGKQIDEVKEISKEVVLDMLGIELGPVRLKCALLSLKVLKGSVYRLGEGEAQDDLME